MPYAKRPKAFTLIELLIVVAIIGLLATITAVAVNGARVKSRDNKRAADFKQIQKALELSYEPGSGYPAVASVVVMGSSGAKTLCAKGGVVVFAADQSPANCDAGKVYMGLVPYNPTPNGDDYTYVSTDGAGALCTSVPCKGYCIQTSLEQGLPQSGLSAGTIIGDPTALKNGSCS